MGAGAADLPGIIRKGAESDESTIRRISSDSLSIYGEYGSWLPGYVTHPGVWTLVYEEEGGVRGFAMLGVLEPERGSTGRVADVLAIAIAQGDQGRGIGSHLLAEIETIARSLEGTLSLGEIRLTVADTNEGAERLFERFGFRSLEGEHGSYEGGQRARRMQLLL